MEINILTWNVAKNLQGRKATSLIRVIAENEIDIFVLQEISQDPKNDVAINKALRAGYKTWFKKRNRADPGEGGYALIYRKEIVLKKFDFYPPIEVRLDAKSPTTLCRPPLKLSLSIKNDEEEAVPISLITWHAPHDGMMIRGSCSAAMNAMRNWKASTLHGDIQNAKNKENLWVLAGDLNILANKMAEFFPSKNGYVRLSSSLDHIIACYGPNRSSSTSITKLKSYKPTGSDHDPIMAAIRWDV